MQAIHTKVLVVGAGPAGYTAAIYAARANLSPVIVQGMQPGGQLTITADVENYPGFADPVMGPELMDQMAKQAERVGTKLIQDTITDVDFTKRPFTCTGESGTYTADTVVIATGAQARWLGLEKEMHYQGYGVSGCATCDGFFYRGKKVVVVGGGNTAMEEALYLSGLAAEVVMIHRRDEFRGERILRDRVAKNKKITVMWDSVLEDIIGEEKPIKGVTGAAIKNVKTDEVQNIDADGIFIAIGHSPSTAVFKDKVKMDDEGYIITKPDSTETSVKGVYAAGDVKDKVYGKLLLRPVWAVWLP